jgi:hypothetical protein
MLFFNSLLAVTRKQSEEVAQRTIEVKNNWEENERELLEVFQTIEKTILPPVDYVQTRHHIRTVLLTCDLVQVNYWNHASIDFDWQVLGIGNLTATNFADDLTQRPRTLLTAIYKPLDGSCSADRSDHSSTLASNTKAYCYSFPYRFGCLQGCHGCLEDQI